MVGEQQTSTKPRNLWGWLPRLIGSPIVSLCLGLVTLALAAKLVLMYAALAAPAITGWSWGSHPSTLLVAYKASACGCGAHLSDAINRATQHHAQVLVVASASDAGDAGLATIRADQRVRVITDVGSRTLSRLCPTGKTTILDVQHGRISHQMTGSVLPDDFFD